MTRATLSEMADLCEIEAIQHRAWAKAREESNKNPRAPRKWTQAEIDETARKCVIFAQMCETLRLFAKHQDAVRAAIKAEMDKAKPEAMEL